MHSSLPPIRALERHGPARKLLGISLITLVLAALGALEVAHLVC